MRRLARLAASAGLAVAAGLGCQLPEDPELARIEDAALHLGASATAPEDDAPGWREVVLPDVWTLPRRARSLEGWYRADVRLPPAVASGEEPAALYLPGFSGRLSLYWNGAHLTDAGPERRDAPGRVSGPLLVPLPAALLRPGANRLAVRFGASASRPDYLREPALGPARRLRPVFERRQLAMNDLPVSLSLLGVVVALVFIAVYRRDASSSAPVWLGVGLLTWSLSVAALYVDLPFTARWADPLRPSLFHGSFVCFALALHRMRGARRPRLEVALAAIWGLFLLAALSVPPLLVYAVAVVWMLPTALLALYLAVQLLRLTRRMSPARRVLALLPLAAGAGFAVHDLSTAAFGAPPADMLLSVFCAPVFALSLAGLFLTDAQAAFAASRRLNRDLEARVAAKHHELEVNYQRLRAAERERAVAIERERMLRDMHDGLGGQLVSTLAMVESGGFQASEVVEALRDSLDDLRLVVHSLDPAGGDLLATLADLRERVEPRLARRGLRFDWRVQDIPPLPGLTPDGLLHVLRIFQEAVTNAVKHSGARTLTIETGTAETPGARHVFLRISDDGRGISGDAPSGRGLSHMRRRAEELGARLEVASGPAEPGAGACGTRVTLRIPLDASRAS